MFRAPRRVLLPGGEAEVPPGNEPAIAGPGPQPETSQLYLLSFLFAPFWAARPSCRAGKAARNAPAGCRKRIIIIVHNFRTAGKFHPHGNHAPASGELPPADVLDPRADALRSAGFQQSIPARFFATKHFAACGQPFHGVWAAFFHMVYSRVEGLLIICAVGVSTKSPYTSIPPNLSKRQVDPLRQRFAWSSGLRASRTAAWFRP